MENLSFAHEIVLGLISIFSFFSAAFMAVLAWNWKDFTKRTEDYKKKMFDLFDMHCKEDTQNFKEVTALAHTLNGDTLTRLDANREQILNEIRGLRKAR